MAHNELQRLLTGNAAFTPPGRIMDSVPDYARTERPSGAPHSIAEELWHIVFWQDSFLRWTRQEELPYPEHAESGWKRIETLDDSEWRALVTKFQMGLSDACQLAGESGVVERVSTLAEPGSGVGFISVQEVLINLAVHNAYHLGRVVQLRQMLNAWPPPGGGDTW